MSNIPDRPSDLTELAAQCAHWEPAQIIEYALTQFDKIAISFSGAEDIVLLDMAVKIKPDIAVFSLDTGRLHGETYRFIERVREHYQLAIELLFPDSVEVERLVREKGLFSFYREGHHECCRIRKVLPLRRRLAVLDAWITGQRKDQSIHTRAMLPTVQRDHVFSTQGHALVKFNPLANWRAAQVWDYIKGQGLPYNPLHERGFVSIGCEPCTRPVLPHQHEREGRWWWEEATKKECGLHVEQAP